MPQFVLHFLGTRDRVCDLLAKELVIALAHSLHGFLDRFFGHAGFATDLSVRLHFCSFDQKWLQPLEQIALATRGEFLRKPGQNLIEQCHRPPLLEDSFRVALVHGFEALRHQFEWSPLERRELARRIATDYFWHIGYAVLWNGGRRREALDAYRQGLRAWPWSLSRWKTYCLARLRVAAARAGARQGEAA